MNTIGRVGRLCWLALMALALLTQASVRAQAPTGDGRTVLLVTGGTPLAHGSDDEALARHLRSEGYVVGVEAAAEVTASDALGASVVVISTSADGTDIGLRLRDVGAAVVTLRAETLPGLGMTGPQVDTAWGVATGALEFEIVDDKHAMAAGMDGVVPLARKPGPLSWGSPNPLTSFEIASLGSGEGVIFAYEQGTEMAGVEAPARRVAFGLSPSTLTPQGWRLLSAAVAWAAVENQAPVVGAGPDLVAEPDQPVLLFGEIREDDHVPDPPGTLSYEWRQVDGPADAVLSEAESQSASARFPKPGSYVLRFTASDGFLSGNDEATIVVGTDQALRSAEHAFTLARPVSETTVLPVSTNVLVVIGSSATAGDNLLIGRLNALGFTPTVKSSSTSRGPARLRFPPRAICFLELIWDG